ncbi:MAG: hypothetical protein NDJ92_13275 [Thermoanaerobaculia bacterium]|nr:hypothetical protein [Thermoanaerobaculia bacterium]
MRSLWPLRLALARLRPFDATAIARVVVVGAIFGAFLYGDFRVFQRLFEMTAQIEALTPFFAIGLVQNLLGLVFLIALFVLFFSALTSSIGAFFADLDLETYHCAPVPRARIVASRWAKTFVQSSYLVIAFLLPMFYALGRQYDRGGEVLALGTLNLLLLLATPVSLAALAIIVMVRYFPVRQVHQIAATLAIVAVTAAIIGLRISRPERLFQNVTTDDLVTVLRAIEMPSADLYPSTWLAEALVAAFDGSGGAGATLKLAALALSSFVLFLAIGTKVYFVAWVRAKETSAPVALGSGALTGVLDRVTAKLDPQVRAILGKEVRILTRDAAQWSQLFMMVALLFLYMYNIRMLPLQGDFRAVLVAYLNLGMTGFVIAATCLRFAYPSISAEGKQYWILESAPVSFRLLLWVKVLVYLVPLLFVGLLLTSLGNVILDAPPLVWAYTLIGAVLVSATLVAMGVGMGAASPDFKLENPLELAMSLGGFAYMAVSLLYVGLMMFLMAKPMHGFMLRMWFGIENTQSALAAAAPVAIALAVSLLLSVGPIEVANWRLVRRQL